MPLKVIGYTSNEGWEINAASKAGRMELYDAAGNAVMPAETFRGIYPITVRQSAATSAGAVVWAMWNQNGSKVVAIKRLFAKCFFDGTAAATLMKYEFLKGINCTAFSGGVQVNPHMKKTSLGNPVSAICRILDTGLTVTGISYPGTAVIPWVQGRVTQTTTNFSMLTEVYLDNGALQIGEIELANQEALVIRQNVVSVVGDNIVGWVEVAER